MIEELRKNVDIEISILREIARYSQSTENMTGPEKAML